MPDEHLALLIGGRSVGASVRRGQSPRNPATGEVIAKLPLAEPADLGVALTADAAGFNNTLVSVAEGPFGAVTESGDGAESGRGGLDAFLNTKFISQL